MRSISRSRSRRQHGSWTWKCVLTEEDSGHTELPAQSHGFWRRGAAQGRKVLRNDCQGGDALGRKGGAEMALDLFDRECDGRARCGTGGDLGDDDVDEIAFGVASTLEDELGDEGVGCGGGVEVGSALEAVGGVGVEEVATAAATDGCGVEPGGFDEDVLCFGGDHGVPAAHDSGQGEGFLFVGYDEVVGFEDAVGAV